MAVRKTIGFRPLQALVIVVLSALVTACAAFAPLYDRAITQASASVLLSQASVPARGLSVSSRALAPQTATDTATLRTLVPARIQAALEPPVASISIGYAVPVGRLGTPGGTVLWRAGMCRHVSFTDGSCPRRQNQVAVSTADAQRFGWSVGTTLRVQEQTIDPLAPSIKPRRGRFTVTGVYRLTPGEFWFGDHVTGLSGLPDLDTGQLQTDDLLTVRGTLDSPFATAWRDATTRIDFLLDVHRNRIDQVLRLARLEKRFISQPSPLDDDGNPLQPNVTAYTGLLAVAADIGRGRSQTQIVVPLLMVQLGLLGVVVLWLVLGAATEQRRPELAVARLRGRGVSGARRMLLGELGTEVLVGFSPGVLAGLGVSWLVRHLWLPLDPPFEITSAFVTALVLAALVLALVVLTTAERAAREPVSALLRRVPARRTGWAVGVVDAMLVSASLLAVVAFAAGDLRGPVALAAPALLALMVGLVLAHLLVPVTATAGRRLLARGHVSTGVSLLQVARRPATRRVVAIVTVASAIMVFSTDALAVGARNRTYAAQQVVGAPAVMSVLGTDVSALRSAVLAADPHGRSATPVVTIAPPGSGGATTLAVLPSGFSRIALRPGPAEDSVPWDRLAAPAVAPLEVVGGRVSLRVQSRVTPTTSAPGRVTAGLGLQVVGPGRQLSEVTVATLPKGTRRAHLVHALVPCQKGCQVTGFAVNAGPLHPVSGRVTVSALTVGGKPVDLAPPGHWLATSNDITGSMTPVPTRQPILPTTASRGALAVEFTATGAAAVVMNHAAVPRRLPALVSGRLPSGASHSRFAGLDLDGTLRSMVVAARLPRLPSAPQDANLVNLDVLQRDGAIPEGSAVTSVWLARDDPVLEKRVTRALAAHGLGVATITRASEVKHGYDQSAAAWSLALAVVVGITGLLIAALVLVVVAATTWRLRSRDYAALRMSGFSRSGISHIATGEQLPVILLAVLAGSVCGVVGAHFSLPSVPLLPVTPAVSTLDLSTSWDAVAAAALTALVVLSAVGWAAGWAVARRASLSRVRESL